MELTYRAFGLTLGSELALPGLPTADDQPDVRILRGQIPVWDGEPIVQYGERFRIRGQECLIHFAAHSFTGYVTNGDQIRFECDPALDQIAGLHVMGSCTGALLFQRGMIPIHGNTITTPKGTFMVVGRIGTGKSTTTMALLRRGHRLLADDISPVSFDTRETRIIPGFPRLKLWKSTLEQFGLDCESFQRVRPGLDKFHCPVNEQFCPEPRKLDAVYVLQPGDSPDVKITPLSGIQRLEGLRAHLYKIRFRDAVRNWPPVLAKACRLADAVQVNIVERPANQMTIETVAEAIEQDFFRR